MPHEPSSCRSPGWLGIVRAESPEHWRRAGELLGEYASSLDFDIEFQGFQEELSTLPGDYALPDGCLLLAEDDGKLIGCVALRKIGDGVCEMKRLYVTPAGRGQAVGQLLVQAVIDEARARGYERMRLDTVPSMRAARALYASFQFRPIAPYRHNPVPGTEFMELAL